MHIAVIGTGNVGRSIAFSILATGLPDELSLVDIKPGLAHAIAEELKHAAAAFRISTEINWFDKDEDLSGADIVIVSAGHPRPPGTKVTRRDLAGKNAEIIKYIAEVVPPRNRGARYVIVTNPVDAMATLFKKVSREEFVISTGDSLETQRFRAKLSEVTGVSVESISGFVGGEHGQNAVILWSTVTIDGVTLNEWEEAERKEINKLEIEQYVKTVSKMIIDYAGATRFGPAAAFTEIVEAIILDERKLISIATPRKIGEAPEPVHVSVPTVVGRSIGPDILEYLTPQELAGLEEAAKAIYRTYLNALEHIKQ